MASWRIKGYVSDSESEDGDLDIAWNNLGPRNVSSEAAQSAKGPTTEWHLNQDLSHGLEPVKKSAPQAENATAPSDVEAPRDDNIARSSELLPSDLTTAEVLQQTLSQGLQVVRDVLSHSQAPPLITYTADEADSPLSTPPDSPVIQPLTVPPATAARGDTVPQAQTIEILPAPRTLRQRNAIQQNPYTLDRAKYKITLAGTGHRPIRDIDNYNAPVRIRHAGESQDSNFEESSQAEGSYGQDSMEVNRPVSTGISNRHSSISSARGDSAWDVEKELPDLNLLLHRTSVTLNAAERTGSTQNTHARHGRTEDSQLFDLPTSDDENRKNVSKFSKMLSSKKQQNSIPSPPRSMSVDSIEMIPLQDDQSGLQSPAPLPTPVVSSGIRARKRLVVEDDSQSAPENEPKQIDSGSPTETDFSEGEQDEPQELRTMQRKVKGVLPASWWSIGRLQRDLKGKRKDTTGVTVNPRQEVGVAQRKTNLTLNRGFNPTLYEDLASEESEDEAAKRPENRYRRTSLPLPSQKLVDASLPESDEAMEIVDEDGFDPMLPPRIYTGGIRRKRQVDLRHFAAEHGRKVSSAKSPRRKHMRDNATKITSQSRKKARRKRSDDTINVLDAPDLQSLSHQSRAPFLRIAAKNAKKRSRPTGSNASGKFFQLSKPDDTDDVLNSLRAHASFRHASRSSIGLDLVANQARPANAENRLKSPQQPSARGRSSRPVALPIEPHRRDPRDVQAPDALPQRHDASSQPDYTLERGADTARFLRLTRLRSLLPVKNRSGHGQFASRHSAPRAAQLEVIRPNYKALSRRVPKVPSLGKVFDAENQHSALATPRSFTADAVTSLVYAQSGRRKKRTPRQSENVRQTLLVPEPPVTRDLQAALDSNDPNIKALLHAEFSDYHTAWFQGRKLNVLCANEITQQRFDTFLRVLKSYLSIVLQNSENGLDARELNSFIHRLLPNRREIGAQGQIGDKNLDVLEHDISVARNVFDLHVCLLNLAPGCAPRPRVLEMMVNFAEAHHEICAIALSAWKEIYTFHHTDPSILHGLASWMYSILSQLVARWTAAETDARADAERSNQHIAGQLIRKVIELNRCQACELLCQAHQVLNTSIENAVSTTEASILLDLTSYMKHLDAISYLAEMAEEVPTTALRIARSFASQIWIAQQPASIAMLLLGGIRHSTASLTTSRTHLTPDLQKAMMQTYFALAQITIKERQKYWDNFFEPTSSFSLNMFVGQSHLETTKTIFYHLLIEHDTDQYLLDFRATILNHWLRCLLQNRDSNCVDLLTLSLFKHENESLAMPTIASSFSSPDGHFTETMIKQSLPEVRHSAVIHIIPYLYSQEHNPEAEWLVGGLDDADAVRLLRTMFSTMKETWMSLNEQPEEQDMYTILVHSALDQYEIYPRSDFKIEPWFLNSATFPQRRKNTLAKLLSGHRQDRAAILHEAKDVFQQEIAHAQRYGRFDALEQELKDIFLPQCQEGTFSNENPSDLLAMHASFVHNTFPAYIAMTDRSLSQARSMVLNVLVYVLDNLECRLSSFAWQPVRPLIQAMEPILSAARISLVSMHEQDREMVFKLTSLVFVWAATAMDVMADGVVIDIEAVCDIAAEDYSNEAQMLLQTVISKR